MAEIIQFSVIILGCELSAVALFRIESDAEMATRAVNCDVLVYLALQSQHSDTITAFLLAQALLSFFFFCHFGGTKGLIKDGFQREVDTKHAHTHILPQNAFVFMRSHLLCSHTYHTYKHAFCVKAEDASQP